MPQRGNAAKIQSTLIHKYIHVRGSYNEYIEYCLKSWKKYRLYADALFSRKSIIMDLFKFQKTVSIIFFTVSTPGTVSIPESQSDSIQMTVFSTDDCRYKPASNQIVNNFLTKTYFAVHIMHYSVNFT